MSATLATPRALTPGVRNLLRACGYDDAIVARLAPADARFFVVGGVLSLVASAVPAASAGYGAALTMGAWAAPALIVVVGLFVLNLLRLHHAGSGYPLHLPIDDIGRWRPAGAAAVVMFVLGLLFTQPLVLLLMRPLVDGELAARDAAAQALQVGLGVPGGAPLMHGLIARSHAAWGAHPVMAGVLSVVGALSVCAPALLRRTGARAVRLYESERWIAERELVDDAWAENLHAVGSILQETAPGFRGEVKVHAADPPYNTRPLVFGLDPALLVHGRVRFVRAKGPIDEARMEAPIAASPSPMAPPAPPASPSSSPAPATPSAALPQPSSDVVAPRPPSPSPSSPSPASPSPSSPLPAAPATVTWVGHTAIGAARMRARDVRADDDGLVLFLTVYLERPRADVLRALGAAEPDAPLFKVFPEWNKLPTLLLKSAGFALDAGLAPLIAIAVDKPVEQVERRLRAAPRDKKVSGVFAPELARRVLRAPAT